MAFPWLLLIPVSAVSGVLFLRKRKADKAKTLTAGAAAAATSAAGKPTTAAAVVVKPGQAPASSASANTNTGSAGAAAPAGTSDPAFAIIDTHDPAPAGDLTIHDKPGGKVLGSADKGGSLTIVKWNGDGKNGWAQVSWAGGRKPAVSGFANRKYLSPQAQGSQATQMVQARSAEQDAADAGNAPAVAAHGEDVNLATYTRDLIVATPGNRPLGVRSGASKGAPFVTGGDPKSGGGVPSGSHVKAVGQAQNGYLEIAYLLPSGPILHGFTHSQFLLTGPS